MLSIDTETTGVDLRHGAAPFYVTTCAEDGTQRTWEWGVDPLTRRVEVVEEDVDEIAELLSPNESGQLILQNAKFDITALSRIRPEFGEYWRWDVTDDTLLAGHILASNQPHDLTSMTMLYLGVDIEPFEKRLEEAVKEARQYCRTHLPEWKIAKKGLSGMPSAGDKTWKFDTWLPKAIRDRENHGPEEWDTILREYADTDSAVTLALWKVMEEELKRRGLEEIYREQVRLVRATYLMECQGVTVSRKRLRKLKKDYMEKAGEERVTCERIAASYGHEFPLPKGGTSKALSAFVFAPNPVSGEGGSETGLGMPWVRRSEKTGAPSLCREALEELIDGCEPRSKPWTFLTNLSNRGKRLKHVGYLDSYEEFWLPIRTRKGPQDFYRLHPSFNPTGTDTLRGSCSRPNAQNISKKEEFNLRYAFGPLPDREWYAMDYENIELRIPAYESGEEAMIELFEKPDDGPYFGSYHLLNASIVYPDLFWPIAEKKGEFKKRYASTYYQWIKNAGFALIYGCQERKFDATARKPGAYAELKAKMPKLFRLAEKWISYANRMGYVETIPDVTINPKRGYPVMCSRAENGRVSPTVPLNYHVQSTACWAKRRAMVRCTEQLERWKEEDGFDGRLIMEIHDELDFDFPRGSTPGANLERARVLRNLMERSGEDIGIPLRVAINYHPNNWAEGESVS